MMLKMVYLAMHNLFLCIEQPICHICQRKKLHNNNVTITDHYNELIIYKSQFVPKNKKYTSHKN